MAENQNTMSPERRERKREVDRQSAARKRARDKGIDVPLRVHVRPRGTVDCSQWVTVSGESAAIELANSKGYAFVDAIDAPLVSEYLWRIQKGRNGVSYAISKSKTNAAKLYLHHLIKGNPGSGLVVDHKDRDGLNCRRDNLRYATFGQNNVNRIIPSGRFIGVSRVVRRWHATFGGRHLGTFPTPELAAIAHDLEAIRIYGDFARTNFPRDLI